MSSGHSHLGRGPWRDGSSDAHFRTDLCQISTWHRERAFSEAANPWSSLITTPVTVFSRPNPNSSLHFLTYTFWQLTLTDKSLSSLVLAPLHPGCARPRLQFKGVGKGQWHTSSWCRPELQRGYGHCLRPAGNSCSIVTNPCDSFGRTVPGAVGCFLLAGCFVYILRKPRTNRSHVNIKSLSLRKGVILLGASPNYILHFNPDDP